MDLILLVPLAMTLPIRLNLPESNHHARATVRRAPPPALLQLTRDDERPTTPAPFWVVRVDEPSGMLPIRAMEPEPRQTTPSMIRARSRHRLLSMLFAAAIIAGGVGVATVFADAAAIAR